jgi:hypothetical protein
MRFPWVFRVLRVLLAIAVPSVAAGQTTFPPSATTWSSARYHGGSDFEFAERLAVDTAGNAYLLGRTFSGDLHPGIAPVATGGGRASATFVLKLDSQGLAVYAVTVGTGFSHLPLDIAVARDGAAHVLSKDGDRTHLVKIDPAGAQVYQLTFDAFGRDALAPKAVAADWTGDAVIAGVTRDNQFVARIDPRGNVVDIDVLAMPGEIRDLAVDEAGAAYVTGMTTSGAFPATPNALQSRYNAATCADVFPAAGGPARQFPCADAFLLKLAPWGEVVYATYFGGTGWDEATSVAVDAGGHALIAGVTRSADLPVARAAQAQCKSGFAPLTCGDAFVAKIDPLGASLVFSTYLGGVDAESINSVSFDDNGAAYVGGTVTGDGLPVLRAPQAAGGGGRTDGFVTALSASGTLLWSTYIGGSEDDRVVGVAVGNGVVHVGGETMSPSWAGDGVGFQGGRDLFSARVWDPGTR